MTIAYANAFEYFAVWQNNFQCNKLCKGSIEFSLILFFSVGRGKEIFTSLIDLRDLTNNKCKHDAHQEWPSVEARCACACSILHSMKKQSIMQSSLHSFQLHLKACVCGPDACATAEGAWSGYFKYRFVVAASPHPTITYSTRVSVLAVN